MHMIQSPKCRSPSALHTVLSISATRCNVRLTGGSIAAKSNACSNALIPGHAPSLSKGAATSVTPKAQLLTHACTTREGGSGVSGQKALDMHAQNWSANTLKKGQLCTNCKERPNKARSPAHGGPAHASGALSPDANATTRQMLVT